MGRTVCTEPQCPYEGALYSTMFNNVFRSGNIIPLYPYNQLFIHLSDECNTANALTIIFFITYTTCKLRKRLLLPHCTFYIVVVSPDDGRNMWLM